MTRLSSQECLVDTPRKSSLASFFADKRDRSSMTNPPLVRHVSETKKLVGKGIRKVGGYTLKGNLGNGASGKVCRVISSDLRPLAMKTVTLPTDPEQKQHEIEVLTNEAICLMTCQGHANILEFEEAMMTDSKFFFVTEEAPLGDIFDQITANGLFGTDVTRFIFHQLMCGIEHMHKRGVGHRDMKPENILFFEGNQIKICDFGFAIEWCPEDGLLTKSLGTVRCLPPEMIKTSTTKQPSHNPFQADIWSCGVVFFYFLTGRFPFDGKTDKDTLKNIVKCNFTRAMPQSHLAVDLLHKMLNTTPSLRLTASEVLKHPYFTRSKSAFI